MRKVMAGNRWVAPGLLLALVLAGTGRAAAQDAPGQVVHAQKIGNLQGGLQDPILQHEAFGIASAGLGDLDGDGLNDLAVGADLGITGGTVRVMFLRTDGTVRAHTKIGSGMGGFAGFLDADPRFGISLANLGDVDGDGTTDLAVGATGMDGGGQNRGAVWVLFLRPDGTVRAEQQIGDGLGGFTGVLDDFDELGRSVASLGDLDGDGTPDLVAGAWGDDDGGSTRGAVWVMFLRPDGTVRAQQKISDIAGGFGGDLDAKDNFGVATACLGDTDGDGLVELAVGASRDDDGGGNHGAVWVLHLRRNGTVHGHHKISSLHGGFTGQLDKSDWFGISVAAPGDLDGDGLADLAVAALQDDDGGHNRGAVWVLFLDAQARVTRHQKISATEGYFMGPLDDLDGFGGSLAGLGDLAAGAVFDDDGAVNAGAAWVLFLHAARWNDLGHALPGAAGAPLLAGSGPLIPDSEASLHLGGAAPLSPTLLVVGASVTPQPFLGGVLVPAPDLVVAGLVTDAGGRLTRSARWPAGLPSGFTLAFQTWIVDPSGPQGFSASNALQSLAP